MKKSNKSLKKVFDGYIMDTDKVRVKAAYRKTTKYRCVHTCQRHPYVLIVCTNVGADASKARNIDARGQSVFVIQRHLVQDGNMLYANTYNNTEGKKIRMDYDVRMIRENKNGYKKVYTHENYEIENVLYCRRETENVMRSVDYFKKEEL